MRRPRLLASSHPELKSRSAQGYNRRQGRFGPLWAERLQSAVVEGGKALAAVALYTDLKAAPADAHRMPPAKLNFSKNGFKNPIETAEGAKSTQKNRGRSGDRAAESQTRDKQFKRIANVMSIRK
jgi:hypothetical protein